jgi:hypothetical protein
MSEAKPAETATEMVANTVNEAIATDSTGRVIRVKRLNALEFYRLSKVLGASAGNAVTMDLATLVSAVIRIDATPIAFPSSERDIEFVIQQLDFHGIAAAGEALKKLTPDDKAELEAAKN